jgi:hypothetical protein
MNQVGAARTAACPKCAEPVLAFDVDVFSWSVLLEDHDLPITADLPGLTRQYRIWEDHGPRLGWTPKYTTDRNWRPIRATHLCPASTYIPLITGSTDDRPESGGGKHKNKNKKEHTS